MKTEMQCNLLKLFRFHAMSISIMSSLHKVNPCVQIFVWNFILILKLCPLGGMFFDCIILLHFVSYQFFADNFVVAIALLSHHLWLDGSNLWSICHKASAIKHYVIVLLCPESEPSKTNLSCL